MDELRKRGDEREVYMKAGFQASQQLVGKK